MPASPLALLPAALAEQTVESLFAMHGRRRPWIYWTCLAAVAAALGALPLVPVELTVRSAGMVRPATERIELRAAVSGRIARILAREGDRVASGTALLELSAPDAGERLERNRAIQREKLRLVADLVKLTDRLAQQDLSHDAGPDLEAGAVTLDDPALTRAYLQFRTQLAAARLAWHQAAATGDRTSALAARGLVTARECDEARFAAARTWTDLQLVAQQALTAWQSQLRDERAAVEQLCSEEIRLQEEVALATVRSPVTGSVQGLIGLSCGSFVAAGQSVGFITPDDRLVVETLVSPRDIALIRVGQPARLQIDAYPYTQWGMLGGVVESVAADATSTGSTAAFRVLVRPTALTLGRPDGPVGAIRKGMTLTARFTLGRRSLLQVLHEDAARWLDPQAGSARS